LSIAQAIEERAYCEYLDLTEAAFFEKAMPKFWENYRSRATKYKLSAKDYMKLARIQARRHGLQQPATTGDLEFVGRAIQSISKAVARDSGGSLMRLLNWQEALLKRK
jgi:hypothetical protein